MVFDMNALTKDSITTRIGKPSPAQPSSKFSAAEDGELVQWSRKGEMAAYDELVRRYQERIYATIYHMTSNHEDANDLAQETFVKAFQALKSFKGDSSFYTWIYRIAINQARNRWRWWRRRRREATVSIDAPEIGGGRLGLVATLKSHTVRDPEQDTLLSERERALKKALSSLKRVYREAVVLRDIEGFAYEEIAATLDISIGTVKSRLARGRQELRRKLEGSL